MTKNLDKLANSIDKLESLIQQNYNADNNNLIETITRLENENKQLKKEYLHLKETSQEVINELNNSIKIIDEFFNKKDANS